MIMDMPTATDVRYARSLAEQALAADRLRAPASAANTARNARAELGRHTRWAPAREALWQLLGGHLPHAARVAILGAGNGDDLPLERIAARAGELTLIDLDTRAIRAARRRQPRRLRDRIGVVEHDITNGAADAIARAAAVGRVPPAPRLSEAPLPGSPYDFVIGDLLYSQLVYPALVDLDVPAARTSAFLACYAPTLTRSVVSRLHVSAPDGLVLHLHDPIAWWPGHPQPVRLERILATAQGDPEVALALVGKGTGPHHSDPRAALSTFAIPIRATTMWRWPFAPRVDYLACATLAGRTSEPM